MRTHVLKTWPQFFQAILDGKKHHEIRKNDRGFAVGDTLELREWDPHERSNYVTGESSTDVRITKVLPHYTGRSLSVRVTYLTPGGAWGLPSNLCVMSIDHDDGSGAG